ncbi:MAG: hypothetical protein [Bacteriophage sp.]|nr:MAG: hypothetical protein [Bacteriophage sp.]
MFNDSQKNKSDQIPFIKTNFEQDVFFLLYIIKIELETANLAINNKELIDRSPINDEYLKQLSSDTSLKIITTLSEKYKQLMLEYFTEESLSRFISERVLLSLMRTSININNEKLFNNTNIADTKKDI